MRCEFMNGADALGIPAVSTGASSAVSVAGGISMWNGV